MGTRNAFRSAVGAVIVAVVAGIAPVAQAATAPPSPGSVAFRHGPHIMPMRGHSQLKRTATTSTPAGLNFQYYGGKVIGSVHVVDVLWGAPGSDLQHTYIPQVAGTVTPNIDTFYEGILGSSSLFTRWLNNDYNTMLGAGSTSQSIAAGTFLGRRVITPSNTSTVVDDTQIQAELSAQIAAGNLPAPTVDAAGNPDTYYSVFFPAGVTVTLGSYRSCQDFLAYHGTVASSGSRPEYYYAVEADQGPNSPCYGNLQTGTPFGDTTVVASHELGEAITDPEVGLASSISWPLAWYDSTTGEIGDGCEVGATGAVQSGNLMGSDSVAYQVQYLWSIAMNACYLPGDFSLSSSSSSVTVAPGSTAQVGIAASPTTGSASDTVALMVSGAPAGVTTNLSVSSFTTPGSSTLGISASASAAPGTYTLLVTGTADGAQHSIAIPVTINGATAPTITSASTTSSAVNRQASFTVTTSGYPTSQISETGALPPGMTFTDNHDGTASIAGTPTAVGAYQFTINATDGTAPDANQVFTYYVGQAPAITSASSTSSVVNQAASFTVTTTGYPTSQISATGALPPGMTFVDNHDGTATIAGTPTLAGAFQITIDATDGTSPDATQTFTYDVDQAPAITSGPTAQGTVGSPAQATVTTSGFPVGALSETGALPPGMTFTDNHDGTASISGTPTTSGTYQFSITATNGIAPDATQAFTYTIDQATAFTSAATTASQVNQAASFTVTTSGYPTATLSESGALPPGMTFADNGNGTATIAGTPTATGTYQLTITAANAALGNKTQTFTYTVDQAPAITSAASTTATLNQAASFTVTTSGYPTSILTETGALPPGVTFVDNGNGTATIAGTPTATGTYSFTITAGNAFLGDATQAFTYVVGQAPAITSASTATASVGTASSFTVTTTGYPVAALSESGSLPPGLTFVDNHNGTATIAGTATTAGTFTFTITASNGVGTNATQAFTYTVRKHAKGHH